MAPDCKSGTRKGYGGSNPPLPNNSILLNFQHEEIPIFWVLHWTKRLLTIACVKNDCFNIIQFIILHLLINFAQYTDSKVIQSLANNLIVCMDILFLLSGYFIFFSISKENLKNYYIKRFIRIISTFYIAFILYFYLIHQELNKNIK